MNVRSFFTCLGWRVRVLRRRDPVFASGTNIYVGGRRGPATVHSQHRDSVCPVNLVQHWRSPVPLTLDGAYWLQALRHASLEDQFAVKCSHAAM